MAVSDIHFLAGVGFSLFAWFCFPEPAAIYCGLIAIGFYVSSAGKEIADAIKEEGQIKK